jgi:hypothetical protein
VCSSGSARTAAETRHATTHVIIIDRPACGLEVDASVVTACGGCTRIDPTVTSDSANTIGLLQHLAAGGGCRCGLARLPTGGDRRFRDGAAGCWFKVAKWGLGRLIAVSPAPIR